MKSNLKISLFGAILAVFLSLFVVSAAENFSVTPESISVSYETDQNDEVTLTINNTGTENLNLTLSVTNPTNNGQSINLDLSDTQIIELGPDNTSQINISFNTGNVLGVFEGEVLVSSESESMAIPVEITVTGEIEGEGSVRFVGESTTLRMESRVDRIVRNIFTIENDGSLNLSDLSIEIERLESSSDSISESDIRFEGERISDFTIETLEVNEEFDIEFEIDLPSNIETGTYRADFTVRGLKNENGVEGQFESETFRLELLVSADDRISFRTFDPLVVFGSTGEIIRDIDVRIDNDGDSTVNDLRLVVVEDFEEIYTSNSFSRSAVSFNPSIFDVRRNDDETVEMDLDIPEDIPQGIYVSTIEVQGPTGERLDDITIEVEVRGDIYIQSIDGLDDSYLPGDVVDLEVEVRNQGNRLTRDIRISGILFDVTQTDSDIEYTAPNFLLDRSQTQTVNLRLRLPEDARDGTFALEINLNYEGEEIRRVEQVKIERPLDNIVIQSASINPPFISCQTTLSTQMRVENLGRFDQDLRVVSMIEGTSISQESGMFELRIDDSAQRTLSLNVGSLEPGTYTVVQRAITSTGKIFQERNTLTINECGDNGVIVNPPNNETNTTGDGEDEKVPFFGLEISPSTFFLSLGLVVVIILIVVSLFFL